jgi:hypothetical protein
MYTSRRFYHRAMLLLAVIIAITTASTQLRAETGMCGGASTTLPFTDVAAGNIFFCSIASAYFTGLTSGTTATTYAPTANVTREQMAAFTTRTLDQAIKRGSKRAALGEWWTNRAPVNRVFSLTGGNNARFLACDGLTVWVSNTESNSVSRVDIKTGQLICTLTGVPIPEQMVIVSGFVYVASFDSPGVIYVASIKDTANGSMDAIAANLGNNPAGITCDGENLWTANVGTGPGTGSISRMKIGIFTPTNFTTGLSQPVGILFDGANLWVTDQGDTSLKRINTMSGAVLQTIALSGTVGLPVFDGTNLWIPCSGPDQVYVVRGVGGLAGTVLAQLTGNGLSGCSQAAFDGERICVVNPAGDSVSLWKASDLSPIGSFSISFSSYDPRGVCSDGTTFFIGLRSSVGTPGAVARF